MKMDVSQFKKISSDGKKTTFKHPNGHTIVVAHGSLGKKQKESLDKLPMYAEGTADVEPTDQDTSTDTGTPQGPVQIFVGGQQQPQPAQPQEIPQAESNRQEQAQERADQTGTPPPAMAPQATAQPTVAQQVEAKEANAKPSVPAAARASAEDDSIPPAQAPVTQQDMPPAAAVQGDQANPDAEAAMQDKQTQGNYQKGFHDYYQNNAQELGQDDAAWQHDLSNGHVSRESYRDLFAKRDTLGKISMLFGLAAGGIGGADTKSANPYLSAMDKQIQGDYEAQAQSKTNAHNFLNLHMQQQMNQAQMKHMGQEGALNEAQAKSVQAETAIKSKALAIANMNRTALHDMVLRTQAMPEGPQKQNFMNALGMMSSAVDANVYNINDMAAMQLARVKMMQGMLGGQDGQGPNTSMMRMMGMKDMAEDIDKKNIPGVGVAKVPLSAEDRDSVNSGVNFQNELGRFIDFTKKNSGSLSPSKIAEGQALSAQLNNSYRAAIHGGVYKESENGFIGKSIDPDPTKFFNNIRVLPKLQAVKQESAAQLNQLLKSKGLPAMQGQSGETQEGASGVSNSGKPIVFRGGKWMYK